MELSHSEWRRAAVMRANLRRRRRSRPRPHSGAPAVAPTRHALAIAVSCHKPEAGREIELQVGDRITDIQTHPTGWWFGELQRGEPYRYGWFPEWAVTTDLERAKRLVAIATSGSGSQPQPQPHSQRSLGWSSGGDGDGSLIREAKANYGGRGMSDGYGGEGKGEGVAEKSDDADAAEAADAEDDVKVVDAEDDRSGLGCDSSEGRAVAVSIPCEPLRLLPRVAALCAPAARRRAAKILSLSPLLVRIDGFLDDRQCQALIQLALKQGLTQEEACTQDDARNVARLRTSAGTWLETKQWVSRTDGNGGWVQQPNEVLADIDRRIAMLTGFPVGHQEPLHVLRYTGGQEYVPHCDYVPEQESMPCGGRVATVLLYLNSCADGGATEFPSIGVTVQPEKGTALFWYNVHATGDARAGLAPDERTLHAGLPVHSGVKFAACKWIHPFAFDLGRDVVQPHEGD